MRIIVYISIATVAIVLLVVSIRMFGGCPDCNDIDTGPATSKDVSQTGIIKLFFYNESKDMDASGNIMCSERGLESVEREIPLSITPIQDAIKLLLQGEITFAEQSRGIDTEFPLSGLNLVSASLTNGSLTLTFADPENKTGGGSCRVNILRAQIEKTAKQFPEVSQVHLVPEELFQP